jgi:cation transport protein ChaC
MEQAETQAVPAEVPTPEEIGLTGGEMWVFGYGSLMWDPGFPYVSRAPAIVHGYHRALCVFSSRWRGTPQRPGLVLGLERGGACRGIAFEVAPAEVEAALKALWAREMRRRVYEPKRLRARLPGRTIQVLAFVANPRHPSYVKELSVEHTARLVATCRGDRGSNVEYLERTVAHLIELGVRDRHLMQVLEAARRLRRERHD